MLALLYAYPRNATDAGRESARCKSRRRDRHFRIFPNTSNLTSRYFQHCNFRGKLRRQDRIFRTFPSTSNGTSRLFQRCSLRTLRF